MTSQHTIAGNHAMKTNLLNFHAAQNAGPPDSYYIKFGRKMRFAACVTNSTIIVFSSLVDQMATVSTYRLSCGPHTVKNMFVVSITTTNNIFL